MAIDYPPALNALLRELRRLPGVGPRSAERIGLWLIGRKDARPELLAEAIRSATEAVQPCRLCGFFSAGDLCEICSQPARSGREICVVEQATDILPIERTGTFGGRYHALGGRLAPLDHIGPDQLRATELLERVRSENPTEVILALSADVEGEATTHFVADLLRSTGVQVTRIAHGLPAGGGLEHADQVTLQRALSGRRDVPSRVV